MINSNQDTPNNQIDKTKFKYKRNGDKSVQPNTISESIKTYPIREEDHTKCP